MKTILIIGAGHAFVYHVAGIRRVMPDAKIMVMDIDTNKAPIAEEYGVRFVPYTSRYEAMTISDVVAVCVPCEQHYAVAKEALEAGKVVLLEKPPTKTVAEFEELVMLSKRVSGAKLFCAFHAAYDRTIEEFVFKMQNGFHMDFGKLIGIRCEFDDPNVKNGIAVSGLGGSWLDSAPNELSVLARFLDISKITIKEACLGVYVPTKNNGSIRVDSSAMVTCEFPGGKIMLLTNWTRDLNRKVTYLVFRNKHGKETLILLHHSKQTIFIGRPGNVEADFVELVNCDNGVPRLENHYAGVYIDLMQMIAKGTDNTELGLRIMQLWTGVYKKAGIVK